MTGAIKVVFLKELLENVRDRRVILSAFFFGVLLAPLVFGLSTTLASKRFMKNQDQALELAVSGAKLAPNLMRFLQENGVEVKETDLDAEAAMAAVRDGKHEQS